MIESVKDIQKAFREARVEGERLLSEGKITFESYAFTMLGFEAKLKEKGVRL